MRGLLLQLHTSRRFYNDKYRGRAGVTTNVRQSESRRRERVQHYSLFRLPSRPSGLIILKSFELLSAERWGRLPLPHLRRTRTLPPGFPVLTLSTQHERHNTNRALLFPSSLFSIHGDPMR